MVTKLAGNDECRLAHFHAVLSFKSIFLRMRFSLVARFFSLVLIICLS